MRPRAWFCDYYGRRSHRMALRSLGLSSEQIEALLRERFGSAFCPRGEERHDLAELPPDTSEVAACDEAALGCLS